MIKRYFSHPRFFSRFLKIFMESFPGYTVLPDFVDLITYLNPELKSPELELPYWKKYVKGVAQSMIEVLNNRSFRAILKRLYPSTFLLKTVINTENVINFLSFLKQDPMFLEQFMHAYLTFLYMHNLRDREFFTPLFAQMPGLRQKISGVRQGSYSLNTAYTIQDIPRGFVPKWLFSYNIKEKPFDGRRFKVSSTAPKGGVLPLPIRKGAREYWYLTKNVSKNGKVTHLYHPSHLHRFMVGVKNPQSPITMKNFTRNNVRSLTFVPKKGNPVVRPSFLERAILEHKKKLLKQRLAAAVVKEASRPTRGIKRRRTGQRF